VTDEILVWEKEHGRTFLVNGMSFIKYIQKTWKDFEEAKQREKDERVSIVDNPRNRFNTAIN